MTDVISRVAICSGLLLIPTILPAPTNALPLSAGDRISITIPFGEPFTGSYEVNLDGTLKLPYLKPLSVSGLEPTEVEQKLYTILTTERYFQPNFLRVSVAVLDWAPVQVVVSGAVYEPSRVLINQPNKDEQRTPKLTFISGDYAPKRYLTSAIQGSGGITPYADIKNIQVFRGDREITIDLSGIFTGEPVQDLPLIAGDRVIVPTLDKFQNELMRPTQITPPGVKVLLSNLTVPATSNASASVNKDSTGFPYGARFSQAVVAANCAGGTPSTNANRRAVLVHTDRLTGKTYTYDRSIEELLRDSTDNTNNPFLQSDDGVACYDSSVSDVRDITRSILDFINPFAAIINLFK
ncbi:Polysaccharide export protein [Tumidithrix helvetica PCC 7403]|uniref:polysaccharide biosynthesis/export family protein n=1 Tax=Tumidithrix helvetica TaxID=3457545 RepID=UPI003C9DA96F